MEIKYGLLSTIAVIYIMLFASCNNVREAKEYDEERAAYLADLHSNPSEYTSSEIKEIERQVELYAQKIEKQVDDIIDAPTESQKKRATINFIMEFNDSPPTLGKLFQILQNNNKADKAKIESIQKRMITVYMMIQKEMDFE